MSYRPEPTDADPPLTRAEAAAASRCLLARWRGRKTGLHPRSCEWCRVPIRELRDRLREFNDLEDERGRLLAR